MMTRRSMEPIAELSVADSRFLGFCFNFSTIEEVEQCQRTLKEQYPTAAHIPIVYKFSSNNHNNKEGYDEDQEPSDSVGPGIMKEIIKKQQQQQQKKLDDNGSSGDDEHENKNNLVVAVVRFWGDTLLGVTCGRLPQCYQSIARLVLHRYFYSTSTTSSNNKIIMQPLELEILNNIENSIYGLGAGDCELILNIVPDDNDDDLLLVDKVKMELNFEGFMGAAGEVLPRLQNLQADLTQNLIPIYRYPGNYSGDSWKTFEWSPTSLLIKKAVEDNLLLPQTMNHCVTNYYRDGTDFIDHHSDKDLDLNRDGAIVSVSLGDERIFELKRRKDPKDITRIILPPRSMLVLGPITNKEFSHSILQNVDSSKIRISLTMREVKTFKDVNTNRLFGQGVRNKSLKQLRKRHLIENGALFSGFCTLSALMVSKIKINNAINNTSTCLIMTGIFATGTLSVRLLTNTWYRQQEEREARDFFSKSSMSGTKY
jgi:putative IMPACT (imprinted ancient) family translation regulator